MDLVEIHDKVSGHLRGPGSGGMAGGAKDADTASGVLDEGKNVSSRSGQCPDFKEVGGEECLCLTTQEGRNVRWLRWGAGSMPLTLSISQTVEGATVIVRVVSSPWRRR